MTATTDTPTAITLRRTGVPARNLPAGLWIDVCDVLKAHGLDAAPSEVVSALSLVVRHTRVERGGRLLPDGRVDNDDLTGAEPSWFCVTCHRDFYSTDSKARHDEYCGGLAANLC